ncbi:MAG: hypothetical protein MJA31_14800 [Clostridia bacterium]|nr:hypothetical protein [Clostridia bacterium]
MSIIRSNIMGMVNQAFEKDIIPIIGVSLLCDPEMTAREWAAQTSPSHFHKINNDLLQLREWIYEFVKGLDIQVIDFCDGFKKKIKESKDVSQWYLDGLHPTPKGNRIMAEIFQIDEDI